LDDKEWQITGTGSTISNTTWNFSDNAEGSYTSGAQTFNVAHTETASYTEEDLTIEQSYDQTNGWTPTSIDGTGTFEYHVNDKTEMSETYTATVLDMVAVSGSSWEIEETDKTDDQEIGYKLVDGEIIREVTSGTIIETSKNSSGYSENGTWTVSTMDIYSHEAGYHAWYIYYNMDTHEEYSTSNEKVITTTWSNTVDNNGDLVLVSDVSAELSTLTSGSYVFDYEFATTDDCYNYTIEGDDDNYFHSHYDSSLSVYVSEEYSSELNETWTKSDGENSFTLSSRDGTYEDSYNADYAFDYNYRELVMPRSAGYSYSNAMSSTYDSYGGAGDSIYETDSFDDEFEKDWTENDVELETSDYLAELIASIAQTQSEYNGENNSDNENFEYTNFYSSLLSCFGMVPMFFTYTSITDNGSNDNYSYAAPTPYDIPQTNNGTLGEPHVDKISSGELTTGIPNHSEKIEEMLEVTDELPIIEQPQFQTPVLSEEVPPNPNSTGWLDNIQTGLDLLGFAPVVGSVADIANGVIHLVRGNYIEAGFSAIAIVPIFGDSIAGVWKAVKVADKVGDAVKLSSKSDDAAGIVKGINYGHNSTTNNAKDILKQANETKGGVYVLKDGDDVVRSGRSNDLHRRELEHKRDPELGKLNFEPRYHTDDYATQRGLEQYVHDIKQPPLNKINPIHTQNPNKEKYKKAAEDFLNQ
jgi:hypothetical protein